METPNYLTEDFLLHTPAARELYHGYAEQMPIIDYHCHLPPAEVAGDKRWENLAQVWLGGDHYKWRAMRSNGVDERLITGDAPDREKLQAYAETMPRLLRNPLFDWSHLELLRVFGIDRVLTPASAQSIWDETLEKLRSPDCTARGLLRRFQVKVVCTTDDPCDGLENHIALRGETTPFRMLPAWRPDKAMNIARPEAWNAWVGRLAASANRDIASYADLLAALQVRHDFFAANGCRLSDYGIETIPDVAVPTDREMAAIFDKVRAGGAPSPAECDTFLFGMLAECGRMDARSGWTWQLHYGALRNASTRLFRSLGPDTGGDVIGDRPVAAGLARLLDLLDQDDLLPRTILYNLNPRDNALLGAMLGAFQRGPSAGKLQLGSGWWFNDQKAGMRAQLEALSQLGLLSRFVGMLTDSRSFLSYPRHEYFRRILCDLLGADIEAGDVPRDFEWIGGIVRDICYNNAASFFNF